MPQTTESGNADLHIELASPPGWTYTPGDNIIGTVLRRSPIIAPEATVKLALVGRVKTKITTNGSSSHSKYRARWYLFSTTTTQVLFRGPLHSFNENGLSWPFELGIPMRPAESALKDHYSEEGFLPLDKDGLAQHTLPGTFFSKNKAWRTSSEGFVEYYLEAWLQYRRGGLYEVHKSTYPITLRPLSPVIFPGGSDIQHHKIEQKLRSQRLLPGMEHADLTLKQKTQKFLGSSKVPEVHYRIEIGWPRAVQLDNPSPIPFTLNVVPQQEMTSTSIKDIGLKVRLNWMSMIIKSTTTVLAPGDLRRLLTEDDSHTVCHYLNLEKALERLEGPLEFSVERENEPLDMGGLCQLVLHPHGLSAGDRHLATVPTIQPDIITYNIRHSHLLELKLSLSVAGETYTVPMSTELMVLAAD